MSTIPVAALIEAIVVLLTEAYPGPPDPSGTWFIDNEPDSGVLGLIAGLTAEEASTSVHPDGDPGSTIAAHVEHLRWSLANVNATLRGEEYNARWSESWLVQEADPNSWDSLRHALQAEFEALCAALNKQTELEGVYLTGILALAPHAAYHLGVVRQMIERARAI